MAEPQLPVNTVNLAYRGQKVNLEDYPPIERLPRVKDYQEQNRIAARHIDYEPVDIDYSDLAALNKEISDLIMRVHHARIDYRKAKRMATHVKWVYDQERKRTWIQLSGGSEKTREAMAEIMCQDKYTDFLVAQTVADELKELSYTLRTQLDALKELSNNMRRQIDLT